MHQRAGNENVLELHGSIWRVRCDRDGTVEENFNVPLEDKRCPKCGDYLRPDIVWFEDGLNVEVINDAIRAVMNCDLLITIGTSAMVFPAAEIPVIAIQKQIPSIEINLESTPLTPHYQHFMQGSAGEMLRLLWD